MDALLFHPKIVHLPIALAVLMPLISAGLLFAWVRGLLPRRTWIVALALQALLVGSSFVAMRTGESDEERVESVVTEALLEAHEEAAELFTWTASAGLLLFAAAFLLPRERFAVAAATAAAVASIVVLGLGYRVGNAGGELVYRHGAAAAYVTASSAMDAGRGNAAEYAGEDEDD